MQSNNTLINKYFTKISSNIFSYLLNFAVIGIVPKSLGVNELGIFNYTTNILLKFINLLDFRCTTYFYTSISQNNNNNLLIKFLERYV